MKNALLKFAGLFVEKIPVDERGNPLPGTSAPKPAGSGAAQPSPSQQQPASAPQPAQPPRPGQAGQPPMGAPMQGHPPGGFGPGPSPAAWPGAAPPAAPAGAAPGAPAIAVALRAWVPQEYAAHLAPYGLHVIAAGGSVTSEQARGWGADVLVVSAECLGQDMHLLQQPQLPTVFITPQPVMIPDVGGVVQVQEPLRASDVAHAAREAAASFRGP